MVCFFSFSTLNALTQYLLPTNFDKKSVHILMEDTFYVMIFFSVAAFKIHSLSLSFKCLIIMGLRVGLLSSYYLEFVELLGCLYSCLSSSLESFQPFISSDIRSAPFSLSSGSFRDAYNVYVGLLDCVSQVPLGSARFSSIFFLSVPQPG